VNNSVSGNTIENNCVGILSGPAQGANQIGSNNFSGNTNAYVYNSDSYSCSSGRHSGPKGGSGSSRLLPAVQPR
jgi:nitrous oxidase accessory protein NosD